MNVRTKARQRAKQIIFNRKCAAESKALSLCDEIYLEHPDLLKLQKEKNELRGRLLEATLSDGNCDDLKAKLDDIQLKINELLKTYYGNSDVAKPHYTCDKCNDTGVFAGEDCECLKKLTDRIISNVFKISDVYKDCSFDNFSVGYYPESERPRMSALLEHCREYAGDFSHNSRSMLMLGGTGLGKTHLSVAIASEVAKKGFYVIYASAQSLIKQIEDEHFGRSDSDTLGEIYRCELLVLDDLGTEFQSQFNTSVVYDIINTRILNSLPTIISTNLTTDGLRARYTDRIVSRIAYYYDMFSFSGNDIRIAKRAAMMQGKIG